ncbi:Nop14 domain-containing protein [Cephalotus follicularis]|uniref:Nop14 domain-containing protein n=1 Tax=Cephalotus follicularis TaxID=3775 RepID=A0A1Q3BPQ1_CEPFO|nr:Nop14 domain-containing protein [Cephalotus follicularis]
MARTSTELKKKKKTKKSGPVAAAMKQKAPKPNAFESIWSRRKFDIIGKKRRGEECRTGLARSLAIEKRKKTLLKEYEQSTKASVFVDNRIGEQNEGLGEFDKAIMRSQRERQLMHNKKSKYNLSDGEEEEFDIPSIVFPSERDDFEDEMMPGDDDDDDNEGDESEKKSAVLKHLNARRSVDGEEKKHKTKKEVMEEVILKSKYYKAEKAKEKDENEQMMEELDKSFTSLVQSNVLLSFTANTGSLKQDRPDSYDKLVKELALDMRARPSDRTKTPEELAQEEKERLERLEEERQKRMLETEDSSDEDNEDVDKSSIQRPRSISGDDLGDSFSFDEEPRTTKGWVDEILERKDADDSESEDGDSSEHSKSAEGDGNDEGSDEGNVVAEKTQFVKDWEQSDEDNIDTELDKEEEEEEMKPKHDKKSKNNVSVEIKERDVVALDRRKIKSNSEQPSTEPDIPYSIQAPKNLDELRALLENCSNANIILVINRIRGTNAIKLAAENRKKMQVFYGVLLQYFAVLANKKPLEFELLNMLVKPLMEMSVEIPYFAAICARERILQTRTQFCEAIKISENGCWPSLKTLFLLKLWSMIFPCSDFRHAVMTPAILLMCEYLMRCPILSGRDIAIGSFLCSMLFSVTKQSRKFCPEAIMFLRTLLMAATSRKQLSCQDSEFYHLMELKALRPLLRICDCVYDISPLNFLMVVGMQEDSSFFSSDSFRASVLVTVIETLRGFVDSYQGLTSFPEIFLPISVLLLEVAQEENMPDILQDKLKDVAQLIKKKADEHHMLRRPLQMRTQNPVPIKLLNPKFEENFVKGKDYDPDRERAERRKLKKHLKSEAKGAARELRKDNHFLYEVKEKRKALMEEEKTEKRGKAMAFLQEQEHAYKSGLLGKGSKRRR